MTRESCEHNIEPVCDGNSRLLILGSFPSVRSRESGFFYGHPQNRFWKVLAAVYGEAVPADIPAKKALLLRHGVALWDVAARCALTGSADASIRDVQPNDLGRILNVCAIERIFAIGATAAALYRRLLEPVTGRAIEQLPSTSPANAAWSQERLVAAWRILFAE